MPSYTNHDIVPAALYGKNATTGTGNMSTDHYREGFPRYGAPYVGKLPRRLAGILNERFRAGTIRQVIYSYSTPIAWLDGDTWVIPDATYSVTTSAKHQSQLYRLKGSISIPHDCGQGEYMRYVSRQMTYQRGYGSKPGSTAPGPAFVLD